MWLSNVPDYTGGILNAAICTLPSLENIPEAFVAFNCLLNGIAFRSIATITPFYIPAMSPASWAADLWGPVL